MTPLPLQSSRRCLLTLPQELRDEVIDLILHDSTNPTKITASSHESLDNPLPHICQQLRFETLQRIASLRLSPVLRVTNIGNSSYRASWSIPPSPDVTHERIDINIYYQNITRASYFHEVAAETCRFVKIVNRALEYRVKHLQIDVTCSKFMGRVKAIRYFARVKNVPAIQRLLSCIWSDSEWEKRTVVRDEDVAELQLHGILETVTLAIGEARIECRVRRDAWRGGWRWTWKDVS